MRASTPTSRFARRRASRTRRWAVAPLACGLALLWAAPAHAAENPFGTPVAVGGYVPHELLVKFRSGTSPSSRSRAISSRGARALRTLPLSGAQLLRVPAGADTAQTARELAGDPSVAWAEPDSYQRGGSLPDDPMLGAQWALRNTGQSVNGVAGTAGDDIGAAAAWERTTGSHGVLVAVVDSGINFDSPDLAPNIAPGGWDFVQDDGDPSDAYGHGTHVAGIIGARGNDGLGVAGVDWNASILPVRVLDNLNMGDCATVAEGMAYAAEAGARIVNVSIYGYVHCQAEEEVIAAAPGTLFVTIAGNDGLSTGSSPTFPCTDPEPNILCVGATDQNDRLAGFSNYGPGIDLAAPGTNILSTYLRWGPTETLYEDGFETPLGGRWTTSGGWDRTIQNPLHGVFSLTDSPFANYANDEYSYAQRSLDLSGHDDCAVAVQADTALASGDDLLGEVLPDGVHDAGIGALTGTSAGYEQQYFDLAPIEGRSSGTFRFSLLSDAAGVGDGVYLDDFSVRCAPVLSSYTGAPGEYEIDYGTSMAAPYVSGTAALVLSVDPALSATEVKERILGTVDELPGLAGKVQSGGRLDAGRAVGVTPAPGAAGAPEGRTTGQTSAPLSSPSPRSPEAGLAANLAAIRRALERRGARRLLLRTRGLTMTLPVPAPGRYTATLRGIASGSCLARRSGAAQLTLKATPRGRRMLRRSRRIAIVLTLGYAPAGGSGASRSARIMLG